MIQDTRLLESFQYFVGTEAKKIASELNVEISPLYIEALTKVLLYQTKFLAIDLEAFAKHGKRTNINFEDLKLCLRRNPNLLQILSLQKQRKQKRKVSRQSSKKKVQISMPLIKQAWDSSKSLSQNYAKIGLVSFLNGRAGGTLDSSLNYSILKTKLHNLKDQVVEFREREQIEEKSSKVEAQEKLFGEPEYEFDDRVQNLGSKVNLKKLRNFPIETKETCQTEIIDQLKELSKLDSSVPRSNSANERNLLSKLKEKYGNDYEKMSKDLKLNLYQLSPGQLKKKFKRFELE